MVPLNEVEKRFLRSMGVLTGLLLVFLLARVVVTGTFRYWFFIENLALAWIGFGLGWLLARQVKDRRWLSWKNVILTILWLAFLPNTWYVLSDFLHIGYTGEISELYDIVLTIFLVMNGFILGFTNLYLVHQELRKRLSEMYSSALVAVVIFLCSFAIYLGRDLRWNSWDVIANPGGILINISDRVVDPWSYPRAFNVTAMFFVLIGGAYLALWLFIKPKSRSKQ
jgi:uncharacterized membrane protein